SWADPNLNTSLLNAIWGDTDIKQGLYPSPGGKMTAVKSGGNKKTVWQWKLAVLIFKDHPSYREAFALTLNMRNQRTAAKMQSAWAEKIKNRLKRMATIARQHIETLGKTGEGIKHIEDVDLSRDNSFTNKWST
ncbi:hypothetical protein HYPSUDRAFT_152228, partial [Hypholoma sublateritium FD-334 SS-4]